MVPLILAIFMSSFESSLLMTRKIMLKQSVNLVMREVRLGHYPIVTNALLKTQIYNRTIILADCHNTIKVQLDRIDELIVTCRRFLPCIVMEGILCPVG